MSPTVFRKHGYRFFFFSREEQRMHVHVECADGDAKFWLEPIVEVAHTSRLGDRRLREIRSLIEANADEIRTAWEKHFAG